LKHYKLIFGKSVLKKLKKIEKKKDIKNLVSKMLDKIEDQGPKAGKLLDPVINLYEIKSKKPPLRLYFEIIFENNIAEIIDFQMKISQDKQNTLIKRIKHYIKSKRKN
jgi:mRNA-degrading endonuclease RelE of RelBE toxin-antitoxin system